MDLEEEHRILEGYLKEALVEATKKTSDAHDFDGSSLKERVRTVWLAMESIEYTSFLFALTYDFEDVDPPVPPTKGMDIDDLVKQAAGSFAAARLASGDHRLADYTRIRDAVHYLRTAYLELTKRPRRTRQNLTRSSPGRNPSQGTPSVPVSHMSRRRSRSSPVPQRTHPSSTA